MVFMLDNYDSFTYNLVQYFGELGVEMEVCRNDQITVDAVLALNPEAIVVSPGPCSPNEAGIANALILSAAGRVPVLGVCLGHQCIGQVFGGRVVRAVRLMHGKTSWIRHNGREIFKGLENPFIATRYHSLAVERETLPSILEVTADCEDGTIMGLRHRQYPIFGVQFHPESILTTEGKKLLRNFLEVVEEWKKGSPTPLPSTASGERG